MTKHRAIAIANSPYLFVQKGLSYPQDHRIMDADHIYDLHVVHGISVRAKDGSYEGFYRMDEYAQLHLIGFGFGEPPARLNLAGRGRLETLPDGRYLLCRVADSIWKYLVNQDFSYSKGNS